MKVLELTAAFLWEMQNYLDTNDRSQMISLEFGSLSCKFNC